MPLPIDKYALLGDTETAALVGKDGSVDWLCLPRFDSPACFAALLGEPSNGRWLIGPVDEHTCERRYIGHSAALETTWKTETGTVRVVDVMPLADNRHDIVRRIDGVEGTLRLRHEWVVRMSYGKVRPWVSRREVEGQQLITAVAGPDMVILRGPRMPKAHDGMHMDEFDVHEGDALTFSTTWVESHREVPDLLEFDDRIKETIKLSDDWASRCEYTGPYRDAVLRSLVTLRLLTHAVTGGIVAAPTTSLPEHIGGVRNWDYRFCWLRDATFTLHALMRSGHTAEACAWRDWLLRAVAGEPGKMQLMYGVQGERRLEEKELPWLPGYEGSAPVRIGNAAYDQFQLDIYGELMDSMHEARCAGIESPPYAWELELAVMDFLETAWHEPDEGIWEVRGPRRHFTHSKLMAWVAFDRAIRAVEEFGHAGPVERWRVQREAIRQEIYVRGFNRTKAAFVQEYDGSELDASLLMVPLVGFLPADDERVCGTVAAIERELLVDGFVLRYRTEEAPEVDGLPPGEGAFLLCTFWLADNYALAGRLQEARSLFERLLSIRNDLGLLAEQYDPHQRRLLGNFPQAFSHIGLVNTVRYLSVLPGSLCSLRQVNRPDWKPQDASSSSRRADGD